MFALIAHFEGAALQAYTIFSRCLVNRPLQAYTTFMVYLPLINFWLVLNVIIERYSHRKCTLKEKEREREGKSIAGAMVIQSAT